MPAPVKVAGYDGDSKRKFIAKYGAGQWVVKVTDPGPSGFVHLRFVDVDGQPGNGVLTLSRFLRNEFSITGQFVAN